MDEAKEIMALWGENKQRLEEIAALVAHLDALETAAAGNDRTFREVISDNAELAARRRLRRGLHLRSGRRAIARARSRVSKVYPILTTPKTDRKERNNGNTVFSEDENNMLYVRW